MVRIAATELAKNFGRYQDVALTEPVTVMRNGRDRLVMLSAEEYRRLKRRDRRVMALDDFTEADIQAIAKSEPSLEAEQFNHEVE